MRIKPYYQLSRRIIRSNFTRLSFPYKLTFVLTYKCNYRCKTCNIWKKKASNELTFKEIDRFFRKSSDLLWVDLTGGEVMLRRDFLDICYSLTRHCPDLLLLHFPTNGYLTEITVQNVKEISKMWKGKLIITISLDGDEEMNDSIRGVKGGWRRQIETYRLLSEIKGVHTVFGMTLSADNVKHFSVAYDAVKKECPWIRYEDFHVNVFHESEHYFNNIGNQKAGTNDVIATIKEYSRLRGFPLNPVSILEKIYLKKVPQFLRSDKTPIPCHALRSSCFIDPIGNVFPCSIYNRKVGNLRDMNYDLRHIWNLKKTDQLQKDIWHGRCPHCWTPCEAYQSIMGNIIKAIG